MSNWTLTGLPASFTLNGAAEASGDDGVAGVYDISVDVSKLVATSDDAGAGSFSVSVATGHGAAATVRNVSQPEGVLDESVDVAQPVVSSADKVDTADGVGIAAIDGGATYYTNGSAKNLGLLGNGESGAPISLLFDDLLAGTDESTTQELLLGRANEGLAEGERLSLDTTEFKYLDLVNENDGNAWVSCDKDVTIYWPIPPEAADADPESFKVYHFEDLHREYRDELEGQINACNVTSVECEVVGDNIVFTLPADAEGGCFSPFALSWEPGAYDLTYEWNWGETYDGSTLYDAEGNVTKDRPQLPACQTDLAAGTEVAVDTTNSTACVYYTCDDYGNVNGKYTFSGWSAKTVADDPDDVESVAIDDGKLSMPSADVVVSGEWAYIVVAQQTYTVHYVYDNAPEGVETEYPLPVDDGAYVKNEPVAVSSVPAVGAEYEGYTFQGWKPIGDDVVVEDGAFAMPARDVWISGTWKADDDTPYTVEFYYEKNGSYSTEPDEKDERFGTTDSTVSVTEEDKTPDRAGYVFDEDAANVLSGTVARDGSLVLKVYFERAYVPGPDPDDPDEPEDPDTPDTPDDPDEPEDPSDPGEPEDPDTPGDPSEPGDPDTPGDPGDPDTPDTPGDPDTPDTPGEPQRPTKPEIPETGEPASTVLLACGSLGVAALAASAALRKRA